MIPQTQPKVPDVSVIVAVYNTMPYLTECLESLARQTIGLERMEVIAVDDGSTDDSGEELDRFAKAYPDKIKVTHQTNSGGPGQPSNRALNTASGRYVFFIGADDYLGEEALERLVNAADRWESDVVVGRMEGRDGRHVNQQLFTKENPDINFQNSRLPYAVSNTKLFRRSLIERHHIRYPEDMRMGSDQPFTIEAILNAQRISVLNDYTFYYAVRREDSSNITYSIKDSERLECIIKIIEFVAGLVGPGEHRDAILARHFNWELTMLLRSAFLDASREEQLRMCEGIKSVADKYWTPRIRSKMKVSPRVRIGLAAALEVDALCAAIRVVTDPDAVRAPIVSDNGLIFRAHPGFGAGLIDDDLYEVSKQPRLAEIVERTEMNTYWDANGRLLVEARLPVRQRDGEGHADVVLIPRTRAEDIAVEPRRFSPTDAKGLTVGRCPLAVTAAGSEMTVALSAEDLIGEPSARRKRATMHIRFTLGDSLVELPVPAPAQHKSMKIRPSRIPSRVTSSSSADGHFVLDIEPPMPVWMAGAARRRIHGTLKR